MTASKIKYNVFFADDEEIIRDGIRDCLADNGRFNLCGEAGDGEMALTLMQDLKPDILITDIKMPFMDGLELSKIVKKTMPWVRIIVLSGHDEFEFARKSISIGVDEFLLKPICLEDIMKAMECIADVIEAERAKDVDKKKLIEQLNSVNMLVRNQFFEELILGPMSTSEAIDRAERLKINLLASNYTVMLIEIPGNVPDFKMYLMVRELLSNILESYSEVLHFASSADRQILIIKGDDPDNMNETAYVLAGAISVSIQKQLDITVYVGIGGSVSRVSEISNSYGEARRACKYIQLIGNGQIAGFSDLTRDQFFTLFEGSAEKLSAIITDMVKKTVSSRDSRNTSKHSVAIKKAKEYIKENFNDPSMSLYTVSKVVAISPNYFSTIFSQETGELFIEYLTGVRINRSKELLVTSNMLLADIARQVGYNEPHYFNYIFKKYVGVPPGVYRNKNKTEA